MFGYVGYSLKVIVAGIAEMSSAKAKEYSNRAAVATLVLKEVCAMLRTHLSARHITARSTD